MSLIQCALAYHIIDVHLHTLLDDGFKHLVHYLLVGCSCVLEPKGHDLVAIQSSVHNEGGLLLVSMTQGNLMMPGEGTHEAEHRVSDYGVYQFINLGQWRAVLLAGLVVEAHKIHAHSPSSVGLLDQDHMRDPFKVLTFPNESHVQEFLDFLRWGSASLDSHVPFLLHNSLMGRINIQTTL